MKTVRSFFEGRTLAIATMHGKEAILAPLLEKQLGVRTILPPDFNTDALGTFTGEVERRGTPIDTLRQKCILAIQCTEADLAVASEGSFGAHPVSFMLPANEEFLMLYDYKNKWEIIAKELSAHTNFNGKEIQTIAQLKEFATKALFPSHRLIIRNAENKNDRIHKGIGDWVQLESEFCRMIEEYGTAYVETDMRAHYNPTRMQVIALVAQKLLQKIETQCPQCATPGFDVTEVKAGLPCALCGQPTRSVLAHLITCACCGYQHTNPFPHGKHQEDPMYCNYCNP